MNPKPSKTNKAHYNSYFRCGPIEGQCKSCLPSSYKWVTIWVSWWWFSLQALHYGGHLSNYLSVFPKTLIASSPSRISTHLSQSSANNYHAGSCSRQQTKCSRLRTTKENGHNKLSCTKHRTRASSIYDLNYN